MQFNFFVILLVAPTPDARHDDRMGPAAQRPRSNVSTRCSTPRRRSPTRSNPTRLPTAGGLGAIRFDEVQFAYDGQEPVLDGFDLELTAGQSVALVGGTGSGKSTVARLLVRFYDVQQGGVSIDGIDVRDLTLHDVRRSVGIVFEDTLLFHDSVAANIAFACPDADRESIENAARLASAHDFIMGLPDAYDTMLGERGLFVVRGAAPAHRHRPRDHRRSARARARRRHFRGRPIERARDPRGAVDGDGWPHDDRDSASSRHHRARRHGRTHR